jgi:acetyl-CoA carboxylase biotin carboxyl carrier protein
MNLTPQDVQDILGLLDGASYQELNLQTERYALHLRRQPDGQWTQSNQVLTPANWAPLPGAAGAAAPTAAPKAAAVSVPGLVNVVAPLVGNFYVAPKPGAPAFVEVGTRVDKTTVIGLIETMKLMMSVYADVVGVVAEICLGDACFAEQGTVLVRIKPDAAA